MLKKHMKKLTLCMAFFVSIIMISTATAVPYNNSKNIQKPVKDAEIEFSELKEKINSLFNIEENEITDLLKNNDIKSTGLLAVIIELIIEILKNIVTIFGMLTGNLFELLIVGAAMLIKGLQILFKVIVWLPRALFELILIPIGNILLAINHWLENIIDNIPNKTT